MPQIAFVDEELNKELSKLKNDGNRKEVFPEHEFLGSCLRIGFHIADLKELTYVDVMKILVTILTTDNSSKEATQNDIDKLLG